MFVYEKTAKICKNEHVILHMIPQKPKIGEMQKLAQKIAHSVRMMPRFLVFKLYTALIHKNR